MVEDLIVKNAPNIMFLILTAGLALSIVVGIILAYHWHRYARNTFASWAAIITYSAGCLIFLAFMLTASQSL